MKKTIYSLITLSLVLLCACTKTDMDIEIKKSDPKLVLYCFPNTESDTTIISLTTSLPLTAGTQIIKMEQQLTVKNPQITYRVNGQERTVYYTEERMKNVPPMSYYVLGNHQPGDQVSIDASAPGYPDIHAETYIPEMPEVTAFKKAHSVFIDGATYDQYHLTLNDTHTEDYYAVQAYNIHEYEQYRGEGYGYIDYSAKVDTIYECKLTDINIDDEPAINPISTLDDFFSYNNTFLGYFYIFNDNIFNGKSYTLLLNMRPQGDYTYTHGIKSLKSGYQFKLYKISPEYYRFIKSVNDINNNDLGEIGLAPVNPTLNNVTGGYGVVGGYSAVNYMDLKEYDETN